MQQNASLDLAKEVEVVGVSVFGEFVCVKQGAHYFSVGVGNPDEPAEYQPVTAEEAERIRTMTRFSTRPGRASSVDAARRSIAASRDELFAFMDAIDPQAKAARDFLAEHEEEVARRAAKLRA